MNTDAKKEGASIFLSLAFAAHFFKLHSLLSKCIAHFDELASSIISLNEPYLNITNSMEYALLSSYNAFHPNVNPHLLQNDLNQLKSSSQNAPSNQSSQNQTIPPSLHLENIHHALHIIKDNFDESLFHAQHVLKTSYGFDFIQTFLGLNHFHSSLLHISSSACESDCSLSKRLSLSGVEKWKLFLYWAKLQEYQHYQQHPSKTYRAHSFENNIPPDYRVPLHPSPMSMLVSQNLILILHLIPFWDFTPSEYASLVAPHVELFPREFSRIEVESKDTKKNTPTKLFSKLEASDATNMEGIEPIEHKEVDKGKTI